MNNLRDNKNIKSVYVCGPISGFPDFNRQAFYDAADQIHELDDTIDVVNPAELDDKEMKKEKAPKSMDVTPGDSQWVEFLIRDLHLLLDCDCLVVLNGFQNSRGALLECYIAHSLSKPIYHVDDFGILAPADLPKIHREGTILDEAIRLTEDTDEEREPVIDDFTRSAKIISALLGVEISDYQIPIIMVALKMSSFINTPSKKSLASAAGYLRTIEILAAEKKGFGKLKEPLVDKTIEPLELIKEEENEEIIDVKRKTVKSRKKQSNTVSKSAAPRKKK